MIVATLSTRSVISNKYSWNGYWKDVKKVLSSLICPSNGSELINLNEGVMCIFR